MENVSLTNFIDKNSKALLISLNRKGGGPRFTLDFFGGFCQSNSNVYLIWNATAEIAMSDNLKSRVFNLAYPKTVFDLLNPFLFVKTIKMFKKILTENGVDHVIFTMPHPWDIQLAKCAKKNDVIVHRFIHDAKPHLGEFWPTQKYIRKVLVHSDRVYVLSRYVQENLRAIYNIYSILMRLPALQLPESNLSPIINNRYLLFIGRDKKYKGLRQLLAVWNEIDQFDYVLCVAGKSKGWRRNSGVLRINRWLEEFEITNLIQNADLVIFPYIEATQSGLLPIAIQLEKPVLVSEVGALLEQSSSYKNMSSFSHDVPGDLKEKLQNHILRNR
jgi:glycosyltransferase involved in cell wall biosynthesis